MIVMVLHMVLLAHVLASVLCTFWGLCCAAAHRGLHLSVLSSGSWRGRARAYSCEVRGAYLNAWLIYLILGCIYSNTATQQHSNTQHGNTSRALTPETLNPRGAKSHQHTIHGKGAGIFFIFFTGHVRSAYDPLLSTIVPWWLSTRFASHSVL